MDDQRLATVDLSDEVQRLLLHGRDREAAEVAARRLRAFTTTDQHRGGDRPMGPVEQFHELAPLLGGVLAGLEPADLDAQTPCEEFTVRGVLGHMIGGATQFTAAYRRMDAPEVPADVADAPDVVERTGAVLTDLAAAITAPGALDGTLAAPLDTMSAEDFARFVVMDGLVHGWDISTATGQPYDPPDRLVAEVTAFAHQAIGPEMRDGRTFGHEVAAPPGATPMEQLAAFTGRKVT